MHFKKVHNTSYSAVGDSRFEWRPGLAQAPYKGLGALLISIMGVVTAVAVLVASNNDDVKNWRFQPTVYIAIASTVTNVTLAFAYFEGVGISWWYKALKDGTSVGDLHRIWDFGNNFASALLCGRHFNLVALASILVAISPVNGPLLQRASTIINADVHSTQNFDVQVAKLVPQGYTGLSSSRANTVNMLTTNFSAIARDYYSQSIIPLQSACIGRCRTTVLGAGFHANCSSYQAPFNANPGNDTDFQRVTIFSVTLNYAVAGKPTSAALNVQYKPVAGCEGELVVKNCTLQAGTVLYDVVIDGASSTVSLAPGSTIWNDVVVGVPDYLPLEDHSGGLTTYGGLFLAIANQYNTDLQLRFAGGIGWEFDGAQSEASIAYARGIGDAPSCNVHFIDPTADSLQSIRQLMFRTAVLSANSTNIQHVTARGTGTHTVYHTSYLFLALATLASLLAIVAVLFTFHGFWRLGREVSMSPIETSKAFNAPLLRNSDSNAPARSLLKQVGSRPVKYGVVRGPMGNTRAARVSYPPETPNFVSAQGFPYSPEAIREEHQQQTLTSTAATSDTSWPAAFDTSDENDFEMLDQHGNSTAATSWLEMTDPKRVAPITSGISFKG